MKQKIRVTDIKHGDVIRAEQVGGVNAREYEAEYDGHTFIWTRAEVEYFLLERKFSPRVGTVIGIRLPGAYAETAVAYDPGNGQLLWVSTTESVTRNNAWVRNVMQNHGWKVLVP